jgi:hypothetical protein
MKPPYARLVIGILLALFIGGKVAKWWNHLSYEDEVKGRVDATRHDLPHVVESGVVQRGIELVGTVIKGRYTVGEPVLDKGFDTDPESTAKFTAKVRGVICATPDYLDLLAHGYSLDRTYEVGTPHGPDSYHVVATAVDCPGVVVRKW